MIDQFTFKILLVGDGGVGKTSLVRRISHNQFTENIEQTIGVGFMAHTLNINNNIIKLQIWDTAGQEQYHSIGRTYYRNALGVFCVFSIDDYHSFENLGKWLKDARSLCHPNVKIIIIGNKCDLINSKCITSQEIEELLKNYNIKYIESSAKTGKNVYEAFFTLSSQILESVLLNEINIPQRKPNLDDIELKNNDNNNNNKDQCC